MIGEMYSRSLCIMIISARRLSAQTFLHVRRSWRGDRPSFLPFFPFLAQVNVKNLNRLQLRYHHEIRSTDSDGLELVPSRGRHSVGLTKMTNFGRIK